MDFKAGLQKITQLLTQENIDYMIVGGFAMSFYNRFRFTADMDLVLQIYPHDIDRIVKYFPEWEMFIDSFKESAEKGQLFNITDFDSGLKYDFIIYQDNDYSRTAFERRKKVTFMETECFISSPEDLIISKLLWYAASESAKQLEDIEFLLKLPDLNMQYLEIWTTRLNINRYGLF